MKNSGKFILRSSASLLIVWGVIVGCSSVPETPEAYFREAMKAKEEGNYDDAISHWKSVLEGKPHHVPSLTNLGTAYLVNDQPANALTYFERALEQNPGAPELLARKGKAQFMKQEYKKAANTFTKALRRRSSYVYALIHRGRTFVEMDQLERARADFERAMELGEQAKSNFGLALIHIERKEWRKALEPLTRAIQNDSEYKPAYLYRAGVFRELGQPTRQKRDLERYLKLSNPHLSSRMVRQKVRNLFQK